MVFWYIGLYFFQTCVLQFFLQNPCCDISTFRINIERLYSWSKQLQKYLANQQQQEASEAQSPRVDLNKRLFGKTKDCHCLKSHIHTIGSKSTKTTYLEITCRPSILNSESTIFVHKMFVFVFKGKPKLLSAEVKNS